MSARFQQSDYLYFGEGEMTSVEPGTDVGVRYRLHQNYPNPFNSISNFEIRIAKLTDVSLIVYDLLGREIAIIVNDRLAPGNYTRQWDATGLPSGVYFFRLRAGGEIHSRRLILAR